MPVAGYFDQTLTPVEWFDGALVGPSWFDDTLDTRPALTPSAGGATAATLKITAPGRLVSPTYDQVVLADAPRSFWPLNEATGTIAADVAGANPATYEGAITLGQPGIGDGETAALFDGATTSVDLPVAANTPTPTVCSIEAWFKTTATNKAIMQWCNTPLFNGAYDLPLYLDSNGRVTFVTGMLATPAGVASASAYNDGAWHHVVGTLDATSLKLYIDGVLQGTIASVPAFSMSARWWVGIGLAYPYGGSSNGGVSQGAKFSGAIAKPAVYDYVLTPTAVQKHFSAAASAVAAQAATSATATITTRQYLSSRPTTYDGTVLADSPRSFWPLSEPSGTVAADAAGTSPATYQGAITLGQPGIGDSKTAALFDGSTTYVDPSANPQTPSPSPVSIEAWFKTTATNKAIMEWANSAAFNLAPDFPLYLDDTGRLTFYTSMSTSPTFAGVVSAGAYNDGAWHHVVGTFDATSLKLYADGVLLGTIASIPAVSASGWWWVGVGYAHSYNFGGGVAQAARFAGAIAKAAVYDYVLTPTTVQRHFNAATPTSPTVAAQAATSARIAGKLTYDAVVLADAPIGFWPLDELLGTPTARDLSSGGHNGTYIGTAIQGGAGIGDGDSSVQLDGSSGYVNVPYSSALQPAHLSAELWVYPIATNSGTGMFCGNQYAGGPISWEFGTNCTGYAAANDTDFGSFQGGWYFSDTNVVLSLNVWHHMVLTFDGSTMSFYIDGVLCGSMGPGRVPPLPAPLLYDPSPLFIGRRHDLSGAASFFNGKIAKAALYDYALTPAQISYHFNSSSGVVLPTVGFQAPAQITAAASSTSSAAAALAPMLPMLTPIAGAASQALISLTTPTRMTITGAGASQALAAPTAPVRATATAVAASQALAPLAAPARATIAGAAVSQALVSLVTTPAQVTAAGAGASQALVSLVTVPAQMTVAGAGASQATVTLVVPAAALLTAAASAASVASGPLTAASQLTGGPYAPVVLADSPVSYWRLNETSGTVAADVLGARNGTYTGAANNQAPDPGFEAGVTNFVPYAAGGTTALTQSSAQVHGGSFSALITGTTPASGYGEISVYGNPVKQFSVCPGVAYTASVWFYITQSTRQPGLYIRWEDANGLQIGQVPAFGTLTQNAWQQVTLSNQIAPQGAAYARLLFLVEQSNSLALTGTGYVDDWSFTSQPVTLGQPGATSDGDKAVLLDGVNNGGGISLASPLVFPGDFTLEVWSFAASPSGQPLDNHQVWGGPGGASGSCRFTVRGTGIYLGYTPAGAGAESSAQPNTPPGNAATWIHWMAVKQGANATLYRNGVSVATIAAIPAGNCSINALSAGGVYNFMGQLDEIAAYNYALTQAQAQQHWIAGRGGVAPGVATQALLALSGAQFISLVANAQAAASTALGAPTRLAPTAQGQSQAGASAQASALFVAGAQTAASAGAAVLTTAPLVAQAATATTATAGLTASAPLSMTSAATTQGLGQTQAPARLSATGALTAQATLQVVVGQWLAPVAAAQTQATTGMQVPGVAFISATAVTPAAAVALATAAVGLPASTQAAAAAGAALIAPSALSAPTAVAAAQATAVLTAAATLAPSPASTTQAVAQATAGTRLSPTAAGATQALSAASAAAVLTAGAQAQAQATGAASALVQFPASAGAGSQALCAITCGAVSLGLAAVTPTSAVGVVATAIALAAAASASSQATCTTTSGGASVVAVASAATSAVSIAIAATRLTPTATAQSAASGQSTAQTGLLAGATGVGAAAGALRATGLLSATAAAVTQSVGATTIPIALTPTAAGQASASATSTASMPLSALAVTTARALAASTASARISGSPSSSSTASGLVRVALVLAPAARASAGSGLAITVSQRLSASATAAGKTTLIVTAPLTLTLALPLTASVLAANTSVAVVDSTTSAAVLTARTLVSIEN